MRIREVGVRISEARKAKGLSMMALADLIGVTHQAIQKWEAGERLPRANRWEALGRSLEKDPQWFMFGELGVANVSEILDEFQDIKDRVDEALACLRSADREMAEDREKLIAAARRVLEN